MSATHPSRRADEAGLAATADGPEAPIARPRLKSFFRWEAVPPEGVILLSETDQVHLRDEVFSALLPLLDGEHAIEEIFASLDRQFPLERIFAALDGLRRRGYLADGAAGEPAAEVAFWELAGVGPAAARARRDRLAVAVAVASPRVAEGMPLVDLLVSMGVRAGLASVGAVGAVSAEGAPAADLRIVLADDYLLPELEAENQRALAAGRPWILAKPVGAEVWLGPLFLPGRTGCWACLAHRLRGHRRAAGYLGHVRGSADPFGASLAALPSTRQAALALIATEALKWVIDGRDHPLAGQVLSLDMATLKQRRHPLTRRPQCPACGVATAPAASAPLHLEPRPKRATSDGGHRVEPPEETVARLSRHVSPITGIVSVLRPSAEADAATLTHTCLAEHAFAPVHTDPYALDEGLRKRAGGKGMGRAQAMASALGEALERYCGVFQGDEPRVRAARADLGVAAIHPDAYLGYSERQYREREAWNARGSRVYWVPEPFAEESVVDWTPVRSLNGGEPRYLLTAACYYGAGGEGARFAAATSNGCAAGNTLEEAILQGFLELVERDAVAIWWYNRLRRPAVDLGSFAASEPYVERLLAHYHARGRDLWALDVTSDLGIPVCAAVSRRRDAPEEDLLLGFGAHLDARVALLRALTEVNQSLPAVERAGGAAPRYAGSNPDAARWWRTATLDNQPYLRPDAGAPPRRAADHPALASDDLRADVLTCARLAAGRGLDVLVLDQTRADVDLRVVRVVVPGLRHFWARFGPGRLYDVPIVMGLRRAPLDETELNPWVVYF